MPRSLHVSARPGPGSARVSRAARAVPPRALRKGLGEDAQASRRDAGAPRTTRHSSSGPRAPVPLLLLATALLAPCSPLHADAADAADRIGVMTHFAHGWPLELMPRLSATGVSQVRDEVYWDEVETAPGHFEFPEKFDAYLAALRERGVRTLLPLTFANRHHDGGLTPHTEAGFAAYARYCVKVVRRYGDQLSAVEVWNEYNGGFATGPATADRAGTYTRMLRHAYAALKRERPALPVLGASTAGLPFPWLERLAEAGAFAHMDAVSIHPYRVGRAPESLERDLARLRELLARHPGPDRKPLPIWVTEIGWPARAPGQAGGPELDEHTQAAYLVRSLALLLALGVEKAYLYQYLEYGHDAGLGLLRAGEGYPPKPAHAAFATLLARLRGVATVTREPSPPDLYVLRLSPGAPSTSSASFLVWSLTPRTVPTAGAEQLVRLDGSTEPAPDWILLTDTPIYLLGATASPLQNLSFAPAPAPLADSVADFSFDQNRGGWTYGSLAPEAPDFAFHPAEQHRSTDWKREWFAPGTPWSVSEDEQHPAVVAGLAVPAVRRYTSERGGSLRVVAHFQALSDQSDGVRVRILAEGRVRASELIGGPHRRALELDFTCELPPGGHLDFSVDPGPGGSPDHDATRVTVTLFPPSSP